jgi:hypothetical protein
MPSFVHDLVIRLRRRGLPLGVDDCAALRAALGTGSGIGSTDELRGLCITLWAKSRRDAELISSTLHLVDAPRWSAPDPAGSPADAPAEPAPDAEPAGPAPAPDAEEPQDLTIAAPPRGGGLAPPRSGRPAPFLVLRPQYPVSQREVAQIWRRLRLPVRQGPPTELDVEATVVRYASTGVATAPVLVARRANAARLLLIVDRNGSMTPFHGLVDHVVDSIVRAGRLDAIGVAYCRNTPGRSPDRSALTGLTDPLGVELDEILEDVPALSAGRVYHDPDLTRPMPVPAVLDDVAPGSAVVVVSDAGAMRGSFAITRLFDAVAFARAVAGRRANLAWLNPLERDRWPGTTAGQIARHVPMFPLDREGMYAAVDVLRGHPGGVERPV